MTARTNKIPLLDRAERYVASMPGAVSGQGGHQATFAVAVVLIHGFALSENEAWSILNDYNARCTPPWSERELRHKLTSAAKLTRHPKPRGHLRQGQTTAPPLPPKPAPRPPFEPFQFVDPKKLPPPPEESKPTTESEEARRIAAELRKLAADHPHLLLNPDGTLTRDAALYASFLAAFRATYRPVSRSLI